MMAFEIVPFEWRHLAMLEPGEIERRTLGIERLLEMSRRVGPTGFGGTAIHDGRVLGAAGLILDQNNVAHAWVIASDHMRRRPVFMFRTIKRALDKVMKLPEFGTVHISVCAEDMTGRRFAERLGFRPNGVVKANGGEQTYLGYVR